MAMESPLSSLTANKRVTAFKEEAITTSTMNPKSWHRYNNNVFAIWLYGLTFLQDFLNHLNYRLPNIYFMMDGNGN
jgi:hypothetical protein